jgi:tripartite-type tricarboxylate transporter receptor subunit TctC
MKRVLLAVSILCLAFGVVLGAAQAQDAYPSKPIKVVVPYAPGGAVDITARIVTDQMRQALGQPFIIENKPGAFGILGLEEAARAKPDGYTLMFGNNNANVITPILYPNKMRINAQKDVVPVVKVADLPGFLLATKKDFPPTTFAEFIAYAKKNPGKVRFSSVGVGSFPQYDMEILARRTGIDVVHIPNKAGASGMLNDLVSGDAHIGFINAATPASMIRAGQLRPLAVITEQRMPDWPDVPTLTELGFPGIGTLQWLAIFAPAGVPQPVIDLIHKAAVAAVASPQVQEKFKAQSLRASPSATPADAQKFIADEFTLWNRITSEVKLDLPD